MSKYVQTNMPDNEEVLFEPNTLLMERTNMPISSCIVTIINGKIPIRVANTNGQPIKVYADSRLGIIKEYSLLSQNLEEVKQYGPLVV